MKQLSEIAAFSLSGVLFFSFLFSSQLFSSQQKPFGARLFSPAAAAFSAAFTEPVLQVLLCAGQNRFRLISLYSHQNLTCFRE